MSRRLILASFRLICACRLSCQPGKRILNSFFSASLWFHPGAPCLARVPSGSAVAVALPCRARGPLLLFYLGLCCRRAGLKQPVLRHPGAVLLPQLSWEREGRDPAPEVGRNGRSGLSLLSAVTEDCRVTPVQGHREGSLLRPQCAKCLCSHRCS